MSEATDNTRRILIVADQLLDKLLDHNLQFSQQTGSAQIVDDLMTDLRLLSAVEQELEALKREELKLHQSLAQAVSHAEQGWTRYENANRISNGLQQELEALKWAISEAEPVAYLYALEYGNAAVNRKVSEWKLKYPFGVCGADYLRSNDDGMSYVRETPLYTLKGIK